MKSFIFTSTRTAFMLCLILLGACSTVLQEVLKAPEVTVTDFKLAKAGLINQTLAVTLKVKNPNKVPLPIKGFSYKIDLAGDEFANGNTQEEFTIPAGGEKNIDVYVTLNLLRSTSHLLNVVKSGSSAIDYQLSGAISVNLPLMGSIPINKKGKIDLTQ